MSEIKLFLFVLFVSFRSCWSNVLCEPGFCRNYLHETGCTTAAPECGINNSTHSGILLPSPTICNCCDYCLPYIVAGAPCSPGGPGLGTNVGRCGPGLTCVQENGENICKRMDTPCHKAQDDYDLRHANGETGALEERPECDGKGLYAAVSCIPTQTCFCQTEDGKRAFGEVLYSGSETKQNMRCGCSKFHEKMKKSLSSGVKYPVNGPRCTSDGNFNPIQCIGSDCFCVHPVTGVILEGERMNVSLLTDPLTSLRCYDAEFDLFPQQSVGLPPYTYTTTCQENIKNRIELMEESVEAGYNVDFASDFPECLPDGTFGRIAVTSNKSKICVDERRRRIGNYEAFPNTQAFSDMDCKCAVTSLLLTSSETPICCKNGNFRRIQCRRGLCRCVDSDGKQVGKEDANVNHLECYQEDWRNC